MTGAILDIADLTILQRGPPATPVLRGVSLSVQPGRVHGLVGESGAGKSTLARAVLGILPPALRVAGGTIRFAGDDLLRIGAGGHGGDIALIPQDPLSALNPSRLIREQICDGMRHQRGMPRRAALARARELLGEVQIDDPERVLASYPHQLSGGMRQRVLIAAAFATEPRLVIADEPTTALDVTVQKQILRLIRAMQHRHGTAMIFVAHDLGVVAQICDEVSVLYAGLRVDHAPAAELFARPGHAYTAALIACSPRHDRPESSLEPVPDAVFEALKAEIAAHDASAGLGP
ncbi:MAG: ABC transporter ATP-binding protein [Alphaproteobacteria bacterium]|nr:MAG: ABC transporter ATP-binding protein [Alphaproteobacteria bacterium]